MWQNKMQIHLSYHINGTLTWDDPFLIKRRGQGDHSTGVTYVYKVFTTIANLVRINLIL